MQAEEIVYLSYGVCLVPRMLIRLYLCLSWMSGFHLLPEHEGRLCMDTLRSVFEAWWDGVCLIRRRTQGRGEMSRDHRTDVTGERECSVLIHRVDISEG